MSLEEQLYVKRFYVTENCAQIIPLDNDFGDVNLKPVSEVEHGPYISELEAQAQIATLRTERLQEGWKKWSRDQQDLLKGKQNLCIYYSVQEKFIPYSDE
ncbi:MAG TPA: hypothetical protein VJA18_05030 [Candidatus Nanoarchaeia archaeon]|nr:hypothetical protein [Candidatus Nanoarchaeia archaeon]